MNVIFKRCKHCGNIVAVVKDSGVPIFCCGEPMGVITPNTSDGAVEKHVPVYEVKGDKVEVRIGEVIHPSLETHYIEWVLLQTKKGNQRQLLGPNHSNIVTFPLLSGDEVVAIYEYCNLHGLFKTK